MRNKILGGIGILWGGAIVNRWLLGSSPLSGTTAYQTGQAFAVALGAAMFVAGLYCFFKKSA